MQQASIMMSLLVAGMGVLWYGLETGQIGGGEAPAEIMADAAGEAVMSAAVQSMRFEAKAEKSMLEQAPQAD